MLPAFDAFSAPSSAFGATPDDTDATFGAAAGATCGPRIAMIASLAIAALAAGLLTPAAWAQPSLTVQNGATFEVQKELDVPGDLKTAGSSAVTFAAGADLTLSGSSAQSVSAGPITVVELTLDNSNGAALNDAVAVASTLRLTSGTLTTDGNLTLTSTGEASTASISASGTGMVSGDVTFERYLDKSDDASHFRMLGAPTATAVDGTGSAALLSNVWTQSVGSGADAQVGDPADASVYRYDESANLSDSGTDLSNGWVDIQDLDTGAGSLTRGKGLLAYLFADDDPRDSVTEGFPKTLSATGAASPKENNGNAVTPPITFTDGDGDGTANNGWNLVANPFMAPIDWESVENDGADLTNVEKTIYVYDAEAGQYATYTADGSAGGSGNQDQYIAPFQAFFVKATGSSPNVGGIDAGDKATGQSPETLSRPGPSGGLAGDPAQITLVLSAEGDSTAETTALRYAEGAKAGKDAYDAYQLLPFGADYALVATEMAGTEELFDHQARPVPAEGDTIGLALKITEGGTYALGAGRLAGVPPGWDVVAENPETGRRWDLAAGEQVAFDYTASQATASQVSLSQTEASARASSPSTSPEAVRRRLMREGAPTIAEASKASGGTGGTSPGSASSGSAPPLRLLVGPDAAPPVELTRFEASHVSVSTGDAPGAGDGRGAVRLQWRTASEHGNEAFEIQRKSSEDGSGPASDTGGWATVGKRAGAGTTTEPQSYQFTDAGLPFAADSLRYRLRQVSTDGSARPLKPVTVRWAPSELRLLPVYPNPARTQATVRYAVPTNRYAVPAGGAPPDGPPGGRSSPEVTIRLYDVLGRRVRTVQVGETEGRHQQVLDLSGLSSGNYFLRLQAGDRARTERLTVVR